MAEPDKHQKIKEILPILWDSYEHIYNVRETGTTNGINYLMIVATFLPIFCLTLYMAFKSSLFLFPILFQIAALLILLKRFLIKGQIPWLELKDTLLKLDDNTFETSLFAELKAFEDDTWTRLGAFIVIIKRALYFLVISIFLTALSSVFVFLHGGIQLYVVTALLVILFFFLCFFYNEVPGSKFEDDKKKYMNDIKKWLEKCEVEIDSGQDSIPK